MRQLRKTNIRNLRKAGDVPKARNALAIFARDRKLKPGKELSSLWAALDEGEKERYRALSRCEFEAMRQALLDLGISVRGGVKPQKKDAHPRTMMDVIPPTSACVQHGDWHCLLSDDALLGKGTFGHVYAAFHKGTGLSGAMKLYVRNVTDASYEVQMYHKIQAHISNGELHPFPRLLYVHADRCAGEQSIQLIVIERFGSDLEKELFKKTWSNDLALSIQVLLSLLSALEYLHSIDIVHLDIKPANVLFTPSTRHVALADFAGSETRFPTGTFFEVCTPTYRAPELWPRGPRVKIKNAVIDCPADVWGAGCIFRNVLTGKKIVRSA